MRDEKLTGGCGCGRVRFEIDGAALLEAGYCHCTRCHHRTGTAASVSARAAPGAYRVVQGAGDIRYWRPEGGWPKAFCGTCGSALYSEHPHDPEIRSVRLGSFDSDPGIRPSYRQFVAYAVGWEPIPEDGLPRYDERRPM